MRRRRRARWRRTLVAAARVSLGGLILAGCAPEKLLDSASRLAPGDSARQLARGAAYGADPRQRLDVWGPKRASGALLPVVIFFYGGAWNSGERGGYGFAGRAFAAHDFIAVIPDYRLAPQVRFPSFVEDGAAAVRWVRDHAAAYGGDPARITLAGHSAGSHIAALLALDHHYLRDAGVDPRTIRAAALLSGPYDFLPFTDARAVAAMGQWPRLDETQPIHFAAPGAPPMLLISGGSDITVRARNSQRLAAALSAAGDPVELKIYPGKDHLDTIKSLSPLFRGSTPALADMVAFLKTHSR